MQSLLSTQKAGADVLASLVTFALSVQLESFRHWALPETLIVNVFFSVNL